MTQSATYTHGHARPVIRSHRSRTANDSAGYLLPHLKQGMSLLDVGCGPGTITADLAEVVAPGVVTALEVTEETLSGARDEAGRRGVSGIQFQLGNILALDVPDDTFDVVHAHQVLQHVGDPVQALREMPRVCRPGGLVAVRDGDYAGFTWWPLVPELDEWLALYRSAARANGGEADVGAAAVLGPCGWVLRDHPHIEHLVLRHLRTTRVVGRHVGRPRHQLSSRSPAHRLRCSELRGPGPHCGRLEAVGERERRMAFGSSRGTALHSLRGDIPGTRQRDAGL